MLTYLIIGIIVQLVIMIERTIRIPDLWSLLDVKDWKSWTALLVGIIINVFGWPLSIVMEVWLIINGL